MPQFLPIDDHFGAREIAYERQDGRSPVIVFLPGFVSHMQGTKAAWLADWCAQRDHAYLRFDYSGHGQSSGRFEDGCLGQWLLDTQAIIQGSDADNVILVGSSMGAWIGVLIAAALPKTISGLVGIASAPDFLKDFHDQLDQASKRTIRKTGKLSVPSEYGDPLIITQHMITESTHHSLFEQDVILNCPCHFIHGLEDRDIPFERSAKLARHLITPHTSLEFVADGDHRLSRPQDLKRLTMAIDRVQAWQPSIGDFESRTP